MLVKSSVRGAWFAASIKGILTCMLGLLCLPTQGAEFSLPISFELNRGQAPDDVQYISRGDEMTLSLTCSEAVVQLNGVELDEQYAMRMRFTEGANPCRVKGESAGGRANYFLGNAPEKWVTDVPLFSKIRYAQVHDGIDLVFYGNQKRIEYDFVVSPGGEPSQIRLSLEGADKLEIDSNGRLIASLGERQIIQEKPFVYQPGEAQTIVEGQWRVLEPNVVGFSLGEFDRSRTLVIDPVISYSTFLNGNGTAIGNDIVVDDEGYVYVAGETDSPNFPTTGGAYQTELGAVSRDAFIAKLTPAGDSVVFVTYLGGLVDDMAFGLDVDTQGAVYFTGYTAAFGFPLTGGAFKTEIGGATAFAAKLSADGSNLIYSTFLSDGFGGYEAGNAVIVDDDGFAYITGTTTSSSFPVVNAVQPVESSELGEAFVLKLNQTGSDLVFATYWGGSAAGEVGESITRGHDGSIYVVGSTDSSNFPTTPGSFQPTFGGITDGFLLKLDATGTQVVYSTLIGGSNRDQAYDVAVDMFGHAFVVGDTGTFDDTFPVTNGAWKTEAKNGEGFVAKFGPNGDALVYSTFVGGNDIESLYSIAIDQAGHAYVAGETNNRFTIPSVNGIPGIEGDFVANIFAKIRSDGSGGLTFFPFGGAGIERSTAIAVDSSCQAYITGATRAQDFPIVSAFQAVSPSPAGFDDVFVIKIDPAIDTDEPTIACEGVVLSTGTPVVHAGTANSIMTAYGANFAEPGTLILTPELDDNNRIKTILGGTCVEVNGVRAPMFAALPTQVNFQNPHQTQAGYAEYRVIRSCDTANAVYSEPEYLWIDAATPSFFNFTNNSEGTNPIAAIHQDGVSFVGAPGLFGQSAASTPAAPGELVSLYATGFSETTPAFEAGQLPGVGAQLTTGDVQVTIGGIEVPNADIVYIGVAPCCAGLYQLVVKIPAGAPSGNHEVVVTILGRPSPSGPFVTVQRP